MSLFLRQGEAYQKEQSVNHNEDDVDGQTRVTIENRLKTIDMLSVYESKNRRESVSVHRWICSPHGTDGSLLGFDMTTMTTTD